MVKLNDLTQSANEMRGSVVSEFEISNNLSLIVDESSKPVRDMIR